MKKIIETSVAINSTPEKVWQVLINFESYSEWNSFITSLSGELRLGSKLQATIQGMKFSPRIISLSNRKAFSWKGKLFFNGLFDGEHSFSLKENPDGTTTLYHIEKFSGLLVGLFNKKIDVDTKNGFEKMNLELKKRVENIPN